MKKTIWLFFSSEAIDGIKHKMYWGQQVDGDAESSAGMKIDVEVTSALPSPSLHFLLEKLLQYILGSHCEVEQFE